MSKTPTLNPDLLAEHYGYADRSNSAEEVVVPRTARRAESINRNESGLKDRTKVVAAIGAAALSVWGVTELANLRGDQEKAPWAHSTPATVHHR